MNRRGFTLAELLIALVLTALAMGVVAEGVRRSLDFQARIETAQIDRVSRNAALGALRTRLERLVPLTEEAGADADSVTTENEETILFSGTASGVRFAATDPAYPSTPGLYAYDIFVEAGGEDDAPVFTVLLHRRALYDLAEFNQTPEGSEPLTLFQSADEPRFSYASGDGVWLSAWSREDVFPSHVRLEFAEGGAAPLVVALPRAAEPLEEDEDTSAPAAPPNGSVTQ
ncbi:prepilin-type N-terminal cleavage/methylation domain-containing protein [Hyphobacterium marinum]|uniref:Prepilin-type N-terminal cleavage/methylation domain-containing protein n=1 Tax=Hyphobacterium marinum TaxID=3116574 RepID=A0ABU7LVY5_9PROT|nr:prepilin-type N-terminal cleavage/methylation domain-containing protein [Hyphobacterium sp. Y6023]MEE2565723.1 prepilin-type N-terminal cleavage/methylation domain-containing protein [Hyphobacterium sp. Y6023]